MIHDTLVVMSSTPESEFSDWFCVTHGTVKQPITYSELECDACIEDDYSEESSQKEEPPIVGGFPLG